MRHECLLERLDKVRQTAPGRWVARCPAHRDRSPSLSVRVSDSGKTLVHCLAGCETADVLAAIGLEFRDLFPDDRPRDQRARAWRSRIPPADLIVMVDEEATLAAMVAAQLLEARGVTEDEFDRLAAAVRRLGWAAAEIRRSNSGRPNDG